MKFASDAQRKAVFAKMASSKKGGGGGALSPSEEKALKEYTKINRGAEIIRSQIAGKPDPIVKDIESGLSKLPVHKGTVYRGTSTSRIGGIPNPGDVIKTNSLMSSTSSRKKGRGFADDVLMVVSKNRTGKSLKGRSDFPEEAEVLFPTGAKFKVRSVRKIARTPYPGSTPNATAIFMEQIQ